MGKYDPLRDHLMSLRGDYWRTTFREIETILGASLPPSARTHRPWWANDEGPNRVQAHAWLRAGWQTADVDMARERVTFERRRAS
jgi:hypothetical protein